MTTKPTFTHARSGTGIGIGASAAWRVRHVQPRAAGRFSHLTPGLEPPTRIKASKMIPSGLAGSAYYLQAIRETSLGSGTGDITRLVRVRIH